MYPSFFLEVHEEGGLFLLESFLADFLSAPVRKAVEYFPTSSNKVNFLLRNANLLE